MKKIALSTMLILATVFTTTLKAQVNVNISVGNQPDWAPVGYNNAQYYYMPDLDVYYDVPGRQFVFLNNNHWMRSSALPQAYRRYDLYQVHKVAINQRNAYLYHDRDSRQYAQFKGKFDQQTIRDSRNNNNYGRNTPQNNNGYKMENSRNRQETVKRDSRDYKNDSRNEDRYGNRGR